MADEHAIFTGASRPVEGAIFTRGIKARKKVHDGPGVHVEGRPSLRRAASCDIHKGILTL